MKREARMKVEEALPASPSPSEKLVWEGIGARLVSIREHSKVDRPRMARAIGVSPTTYGRLERGDREIGAKQLALLGSMGWNLNWVVRGEGPERLDALKPAVQSQSQPVSGEDLNIAMQLADRKIAAARKAPTRAQYAAFVAEIYNAITQGLPDADRFDFATGRRTHQGTGDDDASGQGVGE